MLRSSHLIKDAMYSPADVFSHLVCKRVFTRREKWLISERHTSLPVDHSDLGNTTNNLMKSMTSFGGFFFSPKLYGCYGNTLVAMVTT